MLLTVGHGTKSLDELLDQVADHTRLLVDVRSQPFSRHTLQFNRPRLEARLANGRPVSVS